MVWRFDYLAVIALLGFSPHLHASKDTADYYHSSPQRFIGKEVPIRVVSLAPVPDLTAMDPGFVWFEASTGKPNNEEGKILLRIPADRSAKVADRLNNGSPNGNQVRGVFYSRENGPILPGEISKRAPFYIQIGQKTVSSGPEDMETAAGSLILAPKESPQREIRPTATVKPVQPASVSGLPQERSQDLSPGPRAFLIQGKAGGPKEIKFAKTAVLQGEVWELTSEDGKLSLVSKAKVLAILPLPAIGAEPKAEEAREALAAFDAQVEKHPDAKEILLQAKATWNKTSATATATVAALPELEDVETAAGAEEPEPTSGYPAWFVWSTMALSLIVVFLAWAWSRPRSYLA